MTKRWCPYLATAIVLLALTRPVHAAVDLTGSWYLDVSSVSPPTHFVTLPIAIVQTGSAMTWTLTSTSETLFTGTIDINTGAFTVTGGRCPSFVDTLTGTAALDSSGFTATGNMHYPEIQCANFTVNTSCTGTRGVCGDGVITAVAETCDDGNTTDGDCCSSGCAYELNGSPCSDGNSSTCEICNGSGTCQGSVCPSFDVSGAWVFPSYYLGQVFCLQFAQSGTGVSATPCNGGYSPFAAAPMVGTIDPSTRQFSLTQPPEICQPAFTGDYCTLEGTFVADFSSWSGFWWCRDLSSTPPYPCDGLGDSATGVRESCGDYYVFAASGEQCDNGNVADDCCSSTCQYEPASTSCTYSTPSPCGLCNATGTCQQTTCPFELDHYKCYDGADLKTPPFERQTVATSDQLSNESVTVNKLKYVCAPVNKNGEGINDPSAHLACYKIAAANLQPRPQVEVSTQFQVSRFELKRPQMMCVPASKVLLP